MEAAGVGMYLSDGCSLREVGSEVTPGSMGRWLVEDCGKSGFTGAQGKHQGSAKVTDHRWKQNAWCGRTVHPAQLRVGLYSRGNCESVGK